MAQTTNPRKTVATELKALITMLDPAKYTVSPDATNPYAIVVAHEGKTFRVIVKEVG
jgi:hypothetical protein